MTAWELVGKKNRVRHGRLIIITPDGTAKEEEDKTWYHYIVQVYLAILHYVIQCIAI